MIWNVFYEDINAGEIKIRNVFDHLGVNNDLIKAKKDYNKELKLNPDNEETAFANFMSKLWSSLMYYYWSKCEWEVIISSWPPSSRCKKEKIDVYSQIKMNEQAFSEYVHNHLKEIKVKTTKKGE